MEDGFIEELEGHLRDEIEDLTAGGLTEQEAFETACSNLGHIPQIEKEEFKALQGSVFTSGLMPNFLKVGLRIFRKQMLTSSINIAGLTTAFVALIFIGLFLHDELSYEKHHPDYDKIYRLSYTYTEENGAKEDRAFSSGMWNGVLANRISTIKDHFRFVQISYGYIHEPNSDEYFYEEGIYWSDPNFFDFLSFEMKYGEPEAQLKDISSIVLTESTSRKIFGEINPVGHALKYLRRGNEVNMIVTGVMKDPPSNSLFKPGYVAHIDAIHGIFGEHNRGWIDQNPRPGYMFSYFKVENEEVAKAVGEGLKEFLEEVIPNRATQIDPLITPLRDIHFTPPVKWEIDTPIDRSYLTGLGILGIFILIIALVNFGNLTTANASKRSKEIALRKTLGSSNNQLKLQFFLESTLNVVFSFALSIVVAILLLPEFNNLLSKNISIMRSLSSIDFTLTAILIVAVVVLLTGLLPSIYFSRKFRGVSGLSQIFRNEKINSPARNFLVILQFTVATVLIVSTVTVFEQLNLINQGYLGKSRESVIGIRTSRMGDSLQAQRYKQAIQSIPGVVSNTLGMHLPRQSDFGRINTKYYAHSLSDDPFYWNKFDADGGFLTTYGLKLLAGRDFRKNIEFNALIINETASRKLGLSPEEALGLRLTEDSINYVFGRSHGIVIGVVEDFVYKSIKEEIEPLVICANNYVEGVLSVKLEGMNSNQTISELKHEWLSIYPERPFEYWFLDNEFARMYNQERRLGKIIPFFSALAIVIALMGLFALTLFIAELRKKEIGVRKVLGCTEKGILILLGKQYFRSLGISILIGVPTAYFGLTYWLNNFTYRVSVNAGTILTAILTIIVFFILTVGIKSLQSARNNPVDSLKYE